jgi:hypothetical protein
MKPYKVTIDFTVDRDDDEVNLIITGTYSPGMQSSRWEEPDESPEFTIDSVETEDGNEWKGKLSEGEIDAINDEVVEQEGYESSNLEDVDYPSYDDD